MKHRKKARYNAAIAWIACADWPFGSGPDLLIDAPLPGPEEIVDWHTIDLVADLFGREPIGVARDVIDYRALYQRLET